MRYCSSAMDAHEVVKEKVQTLFCDGVDGDKMVLIGSTKVMMKSWTVDLFSSKTTSHDYHVLAVIGTLAINCRISSNDLYYILVRIFPRICI